MLLVVVLNPKGVNVRTAPTAGVTIEKTLPAGEEIEISHTVTIGKNKWGKIANTKRQYVAIIEGGTQYCVELTPV